MQQMRWVVVRWAVNGLVIKGHGRSKADEITQGINQMKFFVEKDMVNTLKKELAAIRSKINVQL